MTVLEKLRQDVLHHNECYWVMNKPEISDAKYDQLVEKLRKLSPNDPVLDQIGNDKSSVGDKVQHEKRMLSLGKIYSWDDMVKWAKSVARSEDELFAISTKYDGMAMEVNSEGRMITRGNGTVGTDVTHIKSYTSFELPEWSKGGRIVGEFLIKEDRFAKLKTIPEFAEYKTPRNAAAALLTLKPDNPVLKKIPFGLFTFMFHQIHEIDVTLKDLASPGVQKKLENELRNWDHCPCDGLVARLKDNAYAVSLGVTATCPRFARAYKFKEESVEVVVKNIAWQVGETHVTPVCEFDKTIINDVEVERATAHGAQYIEDNNLCVGSTITVVRQGDVIPKVIGVSTPDGLKAVLPTTCPSCGGELIRYGAFLCCVNPECPARIANKIVSGLNILGIKGVGPALALKVVKTFMFRDIIDFTAEIRDAELLKAKSFSASEIACLINGISRRIEEGAPASMLLKSVRIPKVADAFCQSLQANNIDIQELFSRPVIEKEDEFREKLFEVTGFASDAVRSFWDYYDHNRDRFNEYLSMFKILPEFKPVVNEQGQTKGTVCFTGTGPMPRKDLNTLASQNGWSTTDNANLCSVLVCADPNGNSSKLQKARAKGIRIIDYATFLKEVS